MRISIVLCVLATAICAQGLPVDTTWSTFLTNSFDNDKNAPKTLSINEKPNKKGFIQELPTKANEPTYHMFQQFSESRNFNRYFDYLKRSDLYKLMQKAIALEFNIPEEAQNKLIYTMWESYFKNGTNDLPNWYAYYLQEQQRKLRTERIVDQRGVYAAWFKSENGATVKKTFFSGTSPDFDFVAFTLCALQTTRDRQSVKCSFNLDGNPVTAAVLVRRVRDDINILRAEPRQANYLRVEPERHRKKPSDTSEFQKLVDSMWAADEDRAPNGYIDLNWQEHLKKGGRPLKPLFHFVNETLFQHPLYKALLDIYDKKLFTPEVCTGEKPITGEKHDVLQAFFDLLTGSKCFSLAYDYLKKNGHAPQDYEKFLKDVYTLWYGAYSRCKGPHGSSGFEHVFLGELKGSIVDGMHSWIRYYLLEKAGEITYYGYYVHDADFIGTFKYKWRGALKEKGGFFFTSSPAFDFALFTTCVLTQSGNEHCKFKINNEPLFVTSFQQKCDEGHCLSTSYPGISE